SCAYDAVVTVLFNTWKEDILTNSIIWSEINNSLMIEMIHGFNNHTNRQPLSQPQCSLEDVRDCMRRGLTHLSADFQWGGFTSIPSVLQHVLQHNKTITTCVRRCTVSTHPSMQERVNKTCLVTTFPEAGITLQQHLDDFHQELISHCEICDRPQQRKTTFQYLPPLLAFEWPGGEAPTLTDIIVVSTNNEECRFTLIGLIYYEHNHFTAHVKLDSGTWFHDGMVTG
ncbi:hypothetical protein L208DRAFT_1127085, partial [Tricholoma matsutake]